MVSDNGVLSDGTKPLSEAMLSPIMSRGIHLTSWWYFHKNWRYHSVKEFENCIHKIASKETPPPPSHFEIGHVIRYVVKNGMFCLGNVVYIVITDLSSILDISLQICCRNRMLVGILSKMDVLLQICCQSLMLYFYTYDVAMGCFLSNMLSNWLCY